MAVFVEALLGASSRLRFFAKIWKEKDLVDSHPVLDGYVYAPSIELREPLVGQRAREAQHRNVDCVILLLERTRRDSGHCSRRMGSYNA